MPRLSKFAVTFRPYPAGAGSTVHDELWEIEGYCLRDALDTFYQESEFNPEWRVVDIVEREKAELLAALTASARNHHKLMGYVSRRDAYPAKSTEECATKDFEICMNVDCVEARAAIQHAEKEPK